ncbi:MAG: heavy-metal-associated domain-containing protein [Phycisphaerales bacterium]|nr:heavy-metal-associated domain-containing protein [Phycisphaerales bacterium]
MPRLTTIFNALCLALSLLCAACDSQDAQPSNKLVTPPVKTTTLVFDVQGMHCNGCVAAITADVRAIAGVSGAQVSLESHSARVEVADPSLAGKIEAAIGALGYTVKAVPAPKS